MLRWREGRTERRNYTAQLGHSGTGSIRSRAVLWLFCWLSSVLDSGTALVSTRSWQRGVGVYKEAAMGEGEGGGGGANEQTPC